MNGRGLGEENGIWLTNKDENSISKRLFSEECLELILGQFHQIIIKAAIPPLMENMEEVLDDNTSKGGVGEEDSDSEAEVEGEDDGYEVDEEITYY
jgi:hypothetical protein